MPKRKVSESESEEAEISGSESSEEEKPVAKSKSSGKLKKEVAPIKKPKFSSSKQEPQDSGSDGMVKVNGEGDKYIDLGKKKRAVVRSFKGMALLDIREYYGAEGEEKPGKKGISLSLDQWKELKDASETIDKLFSQLKK
ncbi:transcriptional Coactivator p15-domain-containing protein [Panaeolus papilionaceus]|nr:transcriptional Coactivator p15-domain-containing protein [Panaeolus papilionaceus]